MELAKLPTKTAVTIALNPDPPTILVTKPVVTIALNPDLPNLPTLGMDSDTFDEACHHLTEWQGVVLATLMNQFCDSHCTF